MWIEWQRKWSKELLNNSSLHTLPLFKHIAAVRYHMFFSPPQHLLPFLKQTCTYHYHWAAFWALPMVRDGPKQKQVCSGQILRRYLPTAQFQMGGKPSFLRKESSPVTDHAIAYDSLPQIHKFKIFILPETLALGGGYNGNIRFFMLSPPASSLRRKRFFRPQNTKYLAADFCCLLVEEWYPPH